MEGHTFEGIYLNYFAKGAPDGRTIVRRCLRTKVHVRLALDRTLTFVRFKKLFFFVQMVVHNILFVSYTKISVRVTFSMKGLKLRGVQTVVLLLFVRLRCTKSTSLLYSDELFVIFSSKRSLSH